MRCSTAAASTAARRVLLRARTAAQFTLAEINALIAPRPHLSCAGRADPLTPPAGLASLDRELRKAYAALGAPNAWHQVVEDGGHAETPTMRAQVLAWLDRIA